MCPAFVIGVAGLACSIAQAQISVIFSNVASSTTSDIPGTAFKFDNGSGSQFDRPFVAQNGNNFLLVASYDVGATETDNEIIVVGTLSPFSAALVVREGTALPFDGTANFGTFVRTHADINNDGSFAFSCDTTAPTTADEMIVRYNALTTTWDAPVREGQPHAFPSVLTIPSLNWGGVNSDANILADGSIAGRASTFTGTGGSTKQILFTLGTTPAILGETDVTVVAGQLVAPTTQTLDAWTTTDRFRMSDDGLAWIGRGDLNVTTTSDDFIIVNGSIVAQEGAAIPGSGILTNVGVISGDAGSNVISHNGSHYAYRVALADGSLATATDVVIKNGLPAAQTDQPIFVGATELFNDDAAAGGFSTTFFLNAINNNGDIVVGGTTNASDVNANAVLVFNNSVVIAREGDPVDINGNGINDDNAFIDVFNNDDCFLTDSGQFVFQADLQDALGVALSAQALLTISVPICNDLDFNNDGVFPDNQDLIDFIDVFGGATCPTASCDDLDINGDGIFPDNFDITKYIELFGGGSC
jgi:hypothetical protein